jgi:5'-methylthioadenosine nucleosidase
MEDYGCENLIICALSIEAEPIVEQLNLTVFKSPLPQCLNAQTFIRSDIGVMLITLGYCSRHQVDHIGATPASIIAWESIRLIKPNLVINAGTAGGFLHRGAKIGDVYLSNKFVYYHGRHICSKKYHEYSVGKFPCADFGHLSNQIGAKLGVLSSSDSVIATHEDTMKMNALKTNAKDMEAAAIAEICNLNKTPFVALKVITDYVDCSIDMVVQFRDNHQKAAAALAVSVTKLVSAIRTNRGFCVRKKSH